MRLMNNKTLIGLMSRVEIHVSKIQLPITETTIATTGGHHAESRSPRANISSIKVWTLFILTPPNILIKFKI